MLKIKIIDYFLKQAEIGNWNKIKFSDVEKKRNLKRNSIKKLDFTKRQHLSCLVLIMVNHLMKKVFLNQQVHTGFQNYIATG